MAQHDLGFRSLSVLHRIGCEQSDQADVPSHGRARSLWAQPVRPVLGHGVTANGLWAPDLYRPVVDAVFNQPWKRARNQADSALESEVKRCSGC
jgi:hypothetical protein